jgi:hydroxymethylglutaryl-CoA lyase
LNPANPHITVCECWARDGLQGWPTFVSTEEKLRVIDAAADAGVREIDATSFVPTATVPQFADAEALMEGVPDGLAVRVLAANRRGAERAVESHVRTGRVDYIGFPISASEPHNLANLRRDHATHLGELEEMVELALAAGINPLLGIATAFGCPIQGAVRPDTVFGLVDWATRRGIRSVMLADTTGMADPIQARQLFSTAVNTYPDVRFIAHFHDNRGRAMVNSLAAVDVGIRVVDSCLGGVGGEPAVVDQGQAGDLGNLSTEDVASVLQQMTIDTGIELDALLHAGALAEQVLGRPLGSKVLRADVERR